MEIHQLMMILGLLGILVACDQLESQGINEGNVGGRSANPRNANGDMVSGNDAQRTRDAGSNASEAQNSFLSATADANYKRMMEQAATQHGAAMKQCDGMTMDKRKACEERAADAFTKAQTEAERMRDAVSNAHP